MEVGGGLGGACGSGKGEWVLAGAYRLDNGKAAVAKLGYGTGYETRTSFG